MNPKRKQVIHSALIIMKSYLSDNKKIKLSEIQELKRQAESQKQIAGSVYNNYGNMIFGDVSNSELSVDNSINELSHAIDEMGGEDATALHETLDEIKELIENIETSRSIPKQKRLAQKITDHIFHGDRRFSFEVAHGFFYAGIIAKIVNDSIFAETKLPFMIGIRVKVKTNGIDDGFSRSDSIGILEEHDII